eukprot:CAMPEP_0197446080 /NCGR_PEP_ID=MMETSP1175-20131217/11125_1 /TAXON_ID=1003142 /ORGANISM="Triceratium dubium, Strain CCMP147" /LENGTH=231 /DNA_ID=CAMNT_0042977143 /DNA_START=70 /DNA_END=762 /DNA_ORIENTATION=+
MAWKKSLFLLSVATVACRQSSAFGVNSAAATTPSTAFSHSHSHAAATSVYQHGRRASGVRLDAVSTSGMWNAGLSFGKGPFRFYEGFDQWMSPFADEDKEAYPELFELPDGVYEVSMKKPLGIVFEEVDAGRGVYVTDLVEGGNAEVQGTVQKGDVLIGVTAVKVIGAKWERRLIPAKDLDFDTVVGAIGSNEDRWGCQNVILQFARPGEFDEERVASHLDFFNPPGDSPW